MTQARMLLQSAANEIRSLRNENKLMKTRLDMFDDCLALLASRPPEQNMGMSPDILWEIEKLMEDKTNPVNQP